MFPFCMLDKRFNWQTVSLSCTSPNLFDPFLPFRKPKWWGLPCCHEPHSVTIDNNGNSLVTTTRSPWERKL